MEQVKETKELLKGLLVMSKLIVEVSKDGLQAQDAVEVLKKIEAQPEIKALLLSAYNDIGMIKEEMADMDAAKMIEIIAAIMPELKDLIQAIVKKA